jgi:hypothetical protein
MERLAPQSLSAISRPAPLGEIEKVSKARDRGVYVATVGSSNDCYFNPSACRTPILFKTVTNYSVCILIPFVCPFATSLTKAIMSDESQTQIVETADYFALWPLGTGANMSFSHHTALQGDSTLSALGEIIDLPN